MSGAPKDETPPMFPASANVTPVDQIKPPAPDPRNARVHRVHTELAAKVRDGSIYRPSR